MNGNSAKPNIRGSKERVPEGNPATGGNIWHSRAGSGGEPLQGDGEGRGKGMPELCSLPTLFHRGCNFAELDDYGCNGRSLSGP